MTTNENAAPLPAPPRRRSGPKPRGRTVVPLTITVTHAQRGALEATADREKSSISAVIRRFITVGLAVISLYLVTTLNEITIACHTGTEEESGRTRTPRGHGRYSGCGTRETRRDRVSAPQGNNDVA